MPLPHLIDTTRERVRRTYGTAIGLPTAEVVTPALILDLTAARRNITLMAERMSSLPCTIRPHIKVHKSPDLARIQVEAGAAGLSVATVWEAATMLEAGFDDLFVVNTVWGDAQMRLLVELARNNRILVAIDDAKNAEQLASLSAAVGSSLGVLIEVDTGMDRAGVDDANAALELARRVVEIPEIKLEGITGYEGHCSLTFDDRERAAKQEVAMEMFVGVADLLEREGIPVPIRSAGGTATWEWTATYPGVTEIQAGSYVVMDNFHGRMVPEFEIALTVAATVISRPPGRLIIDAGGKTIAAAELATLVGYDLDVVRFDEEHGVFSAGSGDPQLGEVVEVVPGYAPSTVNNFEAFHVVEDGVIVDIWPVVPRGPGHHGLASHLLAGESREA